jgi:hypothetical protein
MLGTVNIIKKGLALLKKTPKNKGKLCVVAYTGNTSTLKADGEFSG